MSIPQEAALLPGVVSLVRAVGDYQMSRFRKVPAGSGKQKQARELVSDVDLNSERQLVEGLRALLPEAGIFGEETGRQGDQRLVWVIDPLDGTTNYLSGLEQFSISVALVVAGEPRLGVVFRPASGECFAAAEGELLTRNGRPVVPVDPDLPLAQALLGTGFPYRSPDLAGSFFPCAQDVLYRCRGIRRLGSAALDLSYVAAGDLQGFWESDLQPYDVAAALLFLKQQGCVVSNAAGLPYDMFSDRVLVCGWPGVHAELQPRVARHYGPAAQGNS
ncbi:inositol monophosphatase [Motiliproteus sp. SC1-56]|uniref:inositol monophosphatase family protein n=1 Tax=Motiliproteus sp. SC1-56 TaxID=2799565 RepID=UPI001A8DA3AA|nr:inositol monophosphatase [Motiliproteus sp. SC1-56]